MVGWWADANANANAMLMLVLSWFMALAHGLGLMVHPSIRPSIHPSINHEARRLVGAGQVVVGGPRLGASLLACLLTHTCIHAYIHARSLCADSKRTTTLQNSRRIVQCMLLLALMRSVDAPAHDPVESEWRYALLTGAGAFCTFLLHTYIHTVRMLYCIRLRHTVCSVVH